MFQKFKRMCRKAKKTIMQVSTKVRMLIIALLGGIPAMAQSTAGDYSAGTTALSTVAEEIVKYVPVMVKLCYAIAGVVAVKYLFFRLAISFFSIKVLHDDNCIIDEIGNRQDNGENKI